MPDGREFGLLRSIGGAALDLHLRLSVVGGAGPRTADIHRCMDAIDIRLRHLLQAGRPDGENQASPEKLLIPGALVFGILQVGLILTVPEFRKIE